MFKKLLCALLSTAIIFAIVPAQSANAASISSAISWAKSIAADDSHGYSQEPVRRWGNPDYDCSSFVISAFTQAGFDVGSATYTGNMKSVFQAAGFTWISSSNIDLSTYTSLQAGDIVWRSGHTELYIGNGKLVGAHGDYDGGLEGDQSGTGKEICVGSYYQSSSSPWAGILRYTGSTASSANTSSGSYSTGTYTTTANLNVRSGAGLAYSIKTTLAKGTSVYVSSVKNGWGKITSGSVTGWVSLEYCTASADPLDTAMTFSFAKKANKAITLQWETDSTVSGYRIYYSTAKNGTYNKIDVGSSTSSYKISGLTKGTVYYFKIRPYRTVNGKKVWGKTSAVKLGTTTGFSSYTVKATTKVNIRKYAGTSYKKLTTVNTGKKMTVVAQTKDKNGKTWYKVKFKKSGVSYTAYVMKSYTKKIS